MGNIIFIEDEAKTKEGDEYTFVERTPTVEEYQRLHREVGGGNWMLKHPIWVSQHLLFSLCGLQK